MTVIDQNTWSESHVFCTRAFQWQVIVRNDISTNTPINVFPFFGG